MTIAGIIGLDQPPTTHHGLLAWVTDVAALTEPDAVVWCDGSDAERERLTHKLIEAGTFIPLETAPEHSGAPWTRRTSPKWAGTPTSAPARSPPSIRPSTGWNRST